MNYPWWTNGDFEHDNHDITASNFAHFNDFQYGYIFCTICHENHYNEECPYFAPTNSWDHFMPPQVSYTYSSPYSYVDETTPSVKEKPTIEEMLQCILDNGKEMRAYIKEKFDERASSFQNLASQISQMASTIEALNQKRVFSDIVSHTPVDDEETCEQVTTGSEEESPMAFGKFGGVCEFDNSGGESSKSVEASSTELQSCCSEEDMNEDVPNCYVKNPPVEILALTEGSQVDFVGCSKNLEAPKFIHKKLNLESSFLFVKVCVLVTLLLEELYALNCNEHPLFLKLTYIRKKGSMIFIVFDTYD